MFRLIKEIWHRWLIVLHQPSFPWLAWYRIITVTMLVSISIILVHRGLLINRYQAEIQAVTSNQKIIAETQERLALTHMDLDKRVTELEKEIFGKSPPEPQKIYIFSPEQWMRNRDRELRKRIVTLEKWRMRVIGEDPRDR